MVINAPVSAAKWSFNVYSFEDLVKRGVLTLSVRCGAIEMTVIIIIISLDTRSEPRLSESLP